MKSPIVSDRRATGLLDRVRDDVSRLRDDIGHLLTHTKRETLPNSAREIADQAKQQFANCGAQVVSRVRELNGRQSAGLIGGAVVLGLLAAGAYALTHHNGHSSPEMAEADLDGEMPS